MTTESPIRRLSLTVWLLSALVVINIAVTLFAVLFPPWHSKTLIHPVPTAYKPAMDEDTYADVTEWPVEKRIAKATVIAITRFEKDGEKYKAIITEILKQTTGVKFNFKVGDEYSPGNYYANGRTRYGDGEIILFTGSHAMMRESSVYSDDRIPAYGDMLISVFRNIIKEQANLAPSATDEGVAKK